MAIEQHIPLLEDILGKWQGELGNDYQGYKNQVYRVTHFCFALHACTCEDRDKVVIAACFHDLGIWTHRTFDYLSPSIDLAKAYLIPEYPGQWIPEIALMIDTHHRIRKYRNDEYPLVDVFRKGDVVDVSLGIVKYGLAGAYVKNVKNRFPNAGFHKRLVQLAGEWFFRHPFRPIPILKW